MIPIDRLRRLEPTVRRRKLLNLMCEIERTLLPPAGADPAPGAPESRISPPAARFLEGKTLSYTIGALDCVSDDEGLPAELRGRSAGMARALRGAFGSDRAPFDAPALLRDFDALRHGLVRATGASVADWDMLDGRGALDPGSRKVSQGVYLYLDDLRSPFNLGSIFRSAESFGVAGVFLSPDAADPGHSRALRSSMGAIAAVPWKRMPLASCLSALSIEPETVFALETGGAALGHFSFPPRGLVVIGSEELGVGPAALALCGGGRVTIPSAGAKGSLNVGVATGILLHAWFVSRRGG